MVFLVECILFASWCCSFRFSFLLFFPLLLWIFFCSFFFIFVLRWVVFLFLFCSFFVCLLLLFFYFLVWALFAFFFLCLKFFFSFFLCSSYPPFFCKAPVSGLIFPLRLCGFLGIFLSLCNVFFERAYWNTLRKCGSIWIKWSWENRFSRIAGVLSPGCQNSCLRSRWCNARRFERY